MPRQFTCPNCRHSYRFLAALAGQSMHCHGCGFVFRIPLVPLADAAGVDFSRAGRWLLRLPSGRQFGPVRREMIVEWLREGRADADCLVSPEESTLWYRVTHVFPQSPGTGGAVTEPASAAGKKAKSKPGAAPPPSPPGGLGRFQFPCGSDPRGGIIGFAG